MAAVDLGQVERLPSMTRAIALCSDLGGFENDKDFARTVGLDPTVWTRIKDGERHYPHDGFEELFNVCGNEVPLHWLAYRRGYVLTPKESELERRLRLKDQENERLKLENRLLREIAVGKAA